MQSVAVLRNFTRLNCAEPKSQGCRKFLFPVRRVGNFNVGQDRAPKGGPTRTVRERESTCWTFTSRYVNKHHQEMWNGGIHTRFGITVLILRQSGFVAT